VSTVYSTRFLQAHGASSGASFTVPNGYVAVVRDADIYSNSTGFSAFYLQGADGQALWYAAYNPGDQKSQQWRGRQVYFAGETISVSVDVGGLDSIDYAVSGYLLSSS